jgi:hypothetical protein
MTFKSEIIAAIQSAADTSGDIESVQVLGTHGSGWNLVNGKMQRLEALVEGYANSIPDRVINRGKPFDGSLNKKIRYFTAPHTINMEETYGITVGDTFDVTGSVAGNNGTLTVDSVSGNIITVTETVISETFYTSLPITIDDPLYNLNIEQTLRKVQADVYDSIPCEATTTVAGTVKKIAAVPKFNSLTTNVVELKFNELIDALRNAGSMSANES